MLQICFICENTLHLFQNRLAYTYANRINIYEGYAIANMHCKSFRSYK